MQDNTNLPETSQHDVKANSSDAQHGSGRRRWRRKKKNSGTLPRARRFLRRISWRLLILRFMIYGTIVTAGLLLALYGVINTFVTPDYLQTFIKKNVEEQTGGRLDIGVVRFNVLKGLRLEKVQFYPPLSGDTRGYLNGGDANPLPLANFDALEIGYSIPMIFAGKLYLRVAQLVEPQLHLRQVDGQWNFDSILAYRREHFPEEVAQPQIDEAKTNDQDLTPSQILPFNPALLFMPLDLMVNNIGIKNLRLDLITEEKGRVTSAVTTNGLSVDLGLNWHGVRSSIWLSLVSPFEQALELDIRKAAAASGDESVGKLKNELSLKVALITRLELNDFSKLRFDFAMKVLGVETPIASYQDVSALIRLRLKAVDEFKGLDIEDIEVDLAEALIYKLTGHIALPKGTFELVNLDLIQKLKLDLKNGATLAKPFVAGLMAQGHVGFDELRVSGDIQPASFSGAEKTPTLPYVSGILAIDQASVSYPVAGVTLDSVSGSMSIQAGPSLGGSGSQVDTSLDLDVPKFSLSQATPVGTVEIGVENLATKLTARALWPEMIAPILRLNVEADKVTAHGQNLPKVEVPLYVDIDANGRQDMEKLAISADVELASLAEISLMADCQSRCERFRWAGQMRLDSLENLHVIALPLASVLNMQDVMPTKLTGTVDLQLAARGRLPDPLAGDIDKLLAEGDVQFNSQFNIAKLSAKLPLYKLDLRNFDTRLISSGNFRRQSVELSQKFNSLKLVLPANDENGKAMPVDVGRFSFDASVVNEIDGPPNLKDILKQLSTSISTRLFVSQVALDGILPRPLSELQFKAEAQQHKVTDVTLNDLEIRMPDFGVSLEMKAETRLDAAFKPTRLRSNLDLKTSHSGKEALPIPLKTSGQFDLSLLVDSPDMKNFDISGNTAFENFNLTALASKETDPPLAVVEDITGSIPFKQRINLEEMMNAFSKTNKDSSSDTKVATAETKDGGADDPNEAALTSAMTKYFEKNEDKLLANTNMVTLVDYPTVRPFFPEKVPLSIKKVEAANLELSKLEFDLEVKQNWFSLNQYVINFLGGKIQGDFQLAFEPMPSRLRTSVHLTRLDSRRLLERFPNLKGKASSWNLFSNPYIDAIVHFKYDLKSNDMQGALEITSIGKDQLNMILFYVDPQEQNQTISDIRKALLLGEVRQVSIPIKNGEIDLAVDVRLMLGAPLPTPKLTRFPISQIIQNFKDQSSNTSAKAPPTDLAPPKTSADESKVSGA